MIKESKEWSFGSKCKGFNITFVAIWGFMIKYDKLGYNDYGYPQLIINIIWG